MRSTLFCLGATLGLGLFGIAPADDAGGPANATEGAAVPGPDEAQQLPVGQTFKNFHFPIYKNGEPQAILSAASATGITVNRAATIDLEIELYDTKGTITTTITSPSADLYVTDHKMRTHDTVKINNPNMDATAQAADFDLNTHKYILRDRVHVVLKHFDSRKSDPNSLPNQPPGIVAPPVEKSATTVPGFNPDLSEEPLPSPSPAAHGANTAPDSSTIMTPGGVSDPTNPPGPNHP